MCLFFLFFFITAVLPVCGVHWIKGKYRISATHFMGEYHPLKSAAVGGVKHVTAFKCLGFRLRTGRMVFQKNCGKCLCWGALPADLRTVSTEFCINLNQASSDFYSRLKFCSTWFIPKANIQGQSLINIWKIKNEWYIYTYIMWRSCHQRIIARLCSVYLLILQNVTLTVHQNLHSLLEPWTPQTWCMYF